MIYVAEIPKENEFCSFGRNLHDFSTEVWSVASKEDFMQVASVRVAGRFDAFVTFEDAVNALHVGSGIEKTMVFMSDEEVSTALDNPTLWGSGEVVEKDEYSLPTLNELLVDAKFRLAEELNRRRHPVQPLFIDEDGNAYFG